MIESTHHPLIQHLVALKQDKRYRDQKRTFLYDATVLVDELPAEPVVRLIYTQDQAAQVAQLPGDRLCVSSRVMRRLSSVGLDHGILAECLQTAWKPFPQGCHILVVDQIQDPGNLGNLMRSALAFGWNDLVLMEGGCDPYNDKVVRAARGAHFVLSFSTLAEQELISWLQSQQIALMVGCMDGESAQQVRPTEKCALALGHEGRGVSSGLLAAGQRVSVPMRQGCESLNVAVAGGILMYLFQAKP